MYAAQIKAGLGGLNLRMNPIAKNDRNIVDQIAPGEEFRIDEHSGSGNGWLKANYKGQSGWVWAADTEPVRVPEPRPPAPPVRVEPEEDNSLLWIGGAVLFAGVVGFIWWLTS